MVTSVSELADALMRNIENKDTAAVAALYHDDIEVWHNFSNACQSKAANLKVLDGLIRSVERLRYDVLERHDLGQRIVQRHNLCCTLRSGEEIVIPACMFIAAIDGKITRIDEYLDTAQASRLRSSNSAAAPG